MPGDMLTRINLLYEDWSYIKETETSVPGELTTLEADLEDPGLYYIGIIELEGKSHEAPYTFRLSLEPLLASAPPPCLWTGTWDTNWGKMVLEQVGDTFTGRYEHDEGRVHGKVFGNKLIGTWSEKPSYQPPNDAGDLELTINPGCGSFEGKWRYGSSGSWDGDWTGTRASGIIEPI